MRLIGDVSGKHVLEVGCGDGELLARNAGLEPSSVTGAIFYPRSAVAARLMRRLDARLGRVTTAGAAFLALVATKANGPRAKPL